MELLGPCRFGGWTVDGDPVAVPHPSPWVQIAAVSQDQTRNTMTLLPGLLGTPKRAKALGVDLGKTIIYGVIDLGDETVETPEIVAERIAARTDDDTTLLIAWRRGAKPDASDAPGPATRAPSRPSDPDPEAPAERPTEA